MKFDAIILGSGQAGNPLAASLAKNGQKVAIVEKGKFGGTCVNTGCTPTKSYIASARRAFVTKNSSNHGVEVQGDVSINLKQIKKRKEEIIGESRSGIEKMLEENEQISVYRGIANFRDNHSLEVNGEVISAEKIFINTGARSRIPSEFENIHYYTNEGMLELEEIPEHLIIVGGGYIGLEFAQMFRRFGSKVSILDHGSRLMKQEDEDISEAIKDILEKEDIKIYFNAKIEEATANKTEVFINIKGSEEKISGSHLLVATGRIPNTDNLGLENTDVELDEKGYIKVNEQLQTSVRHIWALGDCNGEGAFTHTSFNDYQIVNDHLFGNSSRKLSDRFTCYAAYIDPPLARVGMNEKMIKEKGIKAEIASMPMNKISRAKEMGETEGILKIYIEAATKKILGASFLGTRADEYIHGIIDAMYAGTPYTTIRDAVHIHPTVSELIPSMLESPEKLEL
ncbi:mercuric reductase [Zunongwangia sp. F363]|uniref:Mercuric reductase n=1 Tax=Autumnicola tepida TaxID=3075595 RepID=A0ABU3C7B4_9FLAO|nr:mercuric reductase [Zunongwangia sp. F363]MDT0642231.1 mercuric reductase [Zunongwangia sp. F363]